jgi:predicted transcriptional regulator
MSRRSRAYIYFDVLEAIWNGIDIPSRITHETNLSREAGCSVFDALIRSGFINEDKKESPIRYYLTMKGKNALSYYLMALEGLIQSDEIT